MKKVSLALCAAAIVSLITLDTQAQTSNTTPEAKANAPTNACRTIEFTGLKAGEGTLMVAVYASAETFFKQPAWMAAQKVEGTSMKLSVCNLAAEEIAVTAFQDLNGNQKLDTNPLGIPNEPYGASGKPSMFGAPSWNDTKVALKGETAAIVVKM